MQVELYRMKIVLVQDKQVWGAEQVRHGGIQPMQLLEIGEVKVVDGHEVTHI